MLSWFRRGGGPAAIPALAAPEHDDAVENLATGLGAGTPRLLRGAAALIADPAFTGARLVILAGAEADAPEAARTVAAARSGTPCEIAVVAEDPLIQIRLRDLDAALPAGVRVRPVSRTALLARKLLADEARPDRVLRLEQPSDPLTLVIAGEAGPLGAQLALTALRLLQLPRIVPAIALLGPGMPALLARLRAALPELDRCGILTASEIVAPPSRAPALILATDPAMPDATLQTLDPDGIAAIVRPELPSWQATGETLRDDAVDRVARQIHELHLEERIAAGGRIGDQPSQSPWEQLPERFREASRHQASHIAMKLRWAGARPGPGTPFGWTATELAALTEAEHARWATVSRLEGWSYAPVRDDAAKTTPLLVPFEALTQNIRDLDALPVRAAPRHLGQPVRRDVIVALEEDAETPDDGFARSFGALLDGLRADAPVIRITRDTALMRAAADLACGRKFPIQLALTTPPSPDLARQAERIAVGTAAIGLLPAPTRSLRIGTQ